MSSVTLIRRLVPRTLAALACAVPGVTGLTLLLAVSLAGEGDKPAKDKPPAQGDKAAGKTAGPEEKAADDVPLLEAPTGYTNTSNGFEDQKAFNDDRKAFEEVEKPRKNGLGVVYNATSCVSCHQNPVTGGSSQISELRAGQVKKDPNNPGKDIFIEPPGGSLVHQRAINAEA